MAGKKGVWEKVGPDDVSFSHSRGWGRSSTCSTTDHWKNVLGTFSIDKTPMRLDATREELGLVPIVRDHVSRRLPSRE